MQTLIEYIKLLGMTVVYVVGQAIALNVVPFLWPVYNEIAKGVIHNAD